MKESAKRALRDRDRAAHPVGAHGLQVLLREGHRRVDDWMLGGWKAQWRFVIQGLDNQVGKRTEECVGDVVALWAIDRPPQRIDHHLPNQRRYGQDSGPVTAG